MRCRHGEGAGAGILHEASLFPRLGDGSSRCSSCADPGPASRPGHSCPGRPAGVDVGLTPAAGAAACTLFEGVWDPATRLLWGSLSAARGTEGREPQEARCLTAHHRNGRHRARIWPDRVWARRGPGDLPPESPGSAWRPAAAPYHGPSGVVRPYPRRPRLCRSLIASAGTVDDPRTAHGGVRGRTRHSWRADCRALRLPARCWAGSCAEWPTRCQSPATQGGERR